LFYSALEAHREYFKGVSVNSVIVYRGADSRKYLEELAKYGATLVDPASLETYGYGFMHLSKDIDAERAQHLCASIARKFMEAKDYYDLKAFSYFPAMFTFSEFLALAQKCNPDDLPFYISDASVCSTACVNKSGISPERGMG